MIHGQRSGLRDLCAASSMACPKCHSEWPVAHCEAKGCQGRHGRHLDEDRSGSRNSQQERCLPVYCVLLFGMLEGK
eukprot:4051328-Amphidinium_carterae.1